jgi:ankyrin repeat protein
VSTTKLPARPSLEYLRKLAKERLADMRRTEPGAQLAAALLTVAREHGFSSWRALKADIDQQNLTAIDRFFLACKQGDSESVRALLHENPRLVQAREGHNATGLYFAAAAGHRDTVLVLLEAGADIHDHRDVHELGVIGWVSYFPDPVRVPRDVLSLLIERGARHHIFSAMALGEPDLVRSVVEKAPSALDRRMSRLEHRQTPLHFAITRGRDDILDVLIELGADVDAIDGNGQTALEYGMLRGDDAATKRLLAAGARKPQVPSPPGGHKPDVRLAASVQKGVPIIRVPDIAATLRWYASIGFAEMGRYPEDGTTLFWGMVSLGRAELMFEPGRSDTKSVTLLFVTDRIQDLYHFLKSRQMQTVALDVTEVSAEARGVTFVEALHEPVFGGLQFSIEDPNGYVLRFLQESEQEGSR